jgi:hypothetical protein
VSNISLYSNVIRQIDERNMYIESLTNDNFSVEVCEDVRSLGYSEELANLICRILERKDNRISINEMIDILEKILVKF